MPVSKSPIVKKLTAAGCFIFIAAYAATIVPNISIAWAVAILLLTIYLFTFEILRVDVAAIVIMVLLGLSNLFAPLLGLERGLVDENKLFSGFSSNAVISIIAVMIIGAGLDKTGLMSQFAAFILRIGGRTEKRIIPIISSTVAIISSFMQNVGAAALFLPVVSRISGRSGIPMSRLLMPMGFCAILGGTATMIGSSPLILLNDLIHNTNATLPVGKAALHTWGLFSVTPIGITLIVMGVLYFMVAGRLVLPAVPPRELTSESTLAYLNRTYHIDLELAEVEISRNSPILGKKLLDVEKNYNIRVIAMKDGRQIRAGADSLDRDIEFRQGQVLGIVGLPDRENTFVERAHLLQHKGTPTFGDLLSDKQSGMAEIVIPPNSSLLGKSAIDIWMRKRYGMSLMGILRNGEVLYAEDEYVDEIRAIPFQAGDMILVYTTWAALERLAGDKDFIITTEYPRSEQVRPHKTHWALGFFTLALALILLTDLKLSIALMTGAIGMIVSGVLKIEEAYAAVSWKTVFLLASLIPLGFAVESTGTAAWIATHVLALVEDFPLWVIETVLALLATGFTLFMSNVGATVLLVPLAINIAMGIEGANPAVFALIVALATSNSFLIPTHQVNALIMGPAGYRVPDFIKAGGVMTILFIAVLILTINIFGYH